jgi:hypothetical protein
MKGRLILIAPEEQETLRYFWQKHPTGFTWSGRSQFIPSLR